MIPEYNKIDFETDDMLVINAKIKILEEAVNKGLLSQEELQEEKDRVNREFEKYREKHKKLGYAFTWLKSTYKLAD